MAEPTPADKPVWPAMFTPAKELLEWLNTQKPADKAGKKRVVTLRWLVFGELERTAPEPPPTAITHFTPADD